MASHTDRTLFSSDNSSPGYIQSVASSKRKTKEHLRNEELIPSEILDNAGGLKLLLEAYYRFMNLEEFIYSEAGVYSDVVLDNKAVFRVSDPKNENDHFFTDETGASSTLKLTNSDGVSVSLALNSGNVNITNGNDLPGSLALSTSEIGKTLTVTPLGTSSVVSGNFTNVSTIVLDSPNTNINPGQSVKALGVSSEVVSINGTTLVLKSAISVTNGTTLTFTFNTQIAELTTPIKYWAGPGASYVLNTIEESMDIDETSAAYLELIQKEIAAVIPRSIQVNKRNLYKNIIEYYRIRGSSDSIEVFFRLLFDDSVEVEYPWDQTLIPSSGNWEPNADLPKGGRYLDKKGFLSDTIKVQDSLRYQRFSYLIRTGQNLSSWAAVFDRLVHPAGFKYFAEILLLLFGTRNELGDDTKEARALRHIGGPKHNELTGGSYFGYGRENRFTLSSMPDLQPGVIGLEDVALLVEAFVASHLPDTHVKIHKSGRFSLTVDLRVQINSPPVNNPNYGKVTEVEIADTGYGYASAPSVVVNGVARTGTTITQATITTTINALGEIATATITSAGANYSAAFANVAGNPNVSKVSSIEVAPNTTRLYSVNPGINISAPTAKDSLGVFLPTNVTALGKYLLAPTPVDSIQILNRGSGYSSVPTVTISAPPSGTTATAIAIIENNSLSTIVVTNKGTGYVELPTITISGNGTGIARLVPSEIASGAITNPGFGYGVDPTLYISSRASSENRVKFRTHRQIILSNHTDIAQPFVKISNPAQASSSKRGRTLYNGSLLKVGALSSGTNWTISQSAVTDDAWNIAHEVTVAAVGYRSIPENSYYNQKSNMVTYSKLYDYNETLEALANVELQSTSINDINKYNTNTFIHID